MTPSYRRLRFPIALSAFCAALGAGLFPRDAFALGPVDLEVAVRGGYGTSPGGGVNPLGGSIGGRAGVKFLEFYGGLSLLYYFGESTDVPGVPGLLPSGSLSAHSLLYGIDVGYGPTFFDVLTLRGVVGIGNYTLTADYLGASTSGSNLYLEPGITALLSFAGFFVGADANALILPGVTPAGTSSSTTDTAFTVHGQLGMKF
jgi:hypothetical protein